MGGAPERTNGFLPQPLARESGFAPYQSCSTASTRLRPARLAS